MAELPAAPQVYVIAGPNGAGKTTFARTFLPQYAACRHFVNADEIARQLAPADPQSVALRAGRMMLEQLHELASRREDFAFETTLAGRGHFSLLEDLRASGYQTTLFFMWLPKVEMSLARVAERVRHGGHFVPDDDVRRRYQRGIYNLFHLYRPVLDRWLLFDNTTSVPVRIAFEESGSLEVVDTDRYAQVMEVLKSHE